MMMFMTRLSFVSLMVLMIARCTCSPTNDVPLTPCEIDPASCKETQQEPPQLFVNPPFGVGFECVTVGCNQVRTLTLENRGDGIAEITLIRTSVGTSSEFHVTLPEGINSPSEDEPLEITKSTPQAIAVSYSPLDAQSDSGDLVIHWRPQGSSEQPVELTLPITTRTAGDPAAVVLQNEINFGYVTTNNVKVVELTVQNLGAANSILELGIPQLDPLDVGVFTAPEENSWYTKVVNEGTSTTIAVQFAPNIESFWNAQLFIPTNDPAQPQITVQLLGTSIAPPRLHIESPMSGTTVSFSDIRQDTSIDRTVLLRNVGGEPLTIVPQILDDATNAFTLDLTDLPTELLPMEQAAIVMTATPREGGLFDAQLRLTSNENDRDPVHDLALVGYCEAPILQLSREEVDFGDIVQGWDTEAQVVTLSNSGTGKLRVISIAEEVGSSQDIVTILPTLPISLNSDDNPAEILLSFHPLILGDAELRLVITTDAVEDPIQIITVRGSGITCEEGCPVEHGSPGCGPNMCVINQCDAGFHDADEEFDTGCECHEDDPNSTGHYSDILGVCSGLHLGDLWEEDSDGPHNITRSGTLHSLQDVDVWTVKAHDDKGSWDWLDGDEFKASVRLVSAPPGVKLFGHFRRISEGCGGENQRQGGQIYYSSDNLSGSDDSMYIIAWVEWDPAVTEPMCAEYTLKFSADERD